MVREENERIAREAALACCAQCPEPKQERHEVVVLSNGIRMSIFVTHCRAPSEACTALVSSHLVSELPKVANAIVESLAADERLRAMGVGYLACGSSDRLVLTYRVPAVLDVKAAVSMIDAETFRRLGGASAD